MTLLQLLKSRNKSLVLSGPEGSAKSMLSRQLVRCHGSHSVVGIEHLLRMRGFTDYLGVDVVLVEGFPKRKALNHLARLKVLVTNDTAVVRSKGKDDREVPNPVFVFNTNEVIPPGVYEAFHVVQMPFV